MKYLRLDDLQRKGDPLAHNLGGCKSKQHGAGFGGGPLAVSYGGWHHAVGGGMRGRDHMVRQEAKRVSPLGMRHALS